MKIGWIVPTVGIFGAIREVVEVSEALISQGCKITIFSPGGQRCIWLPSRANYASLDRVPREKLDAIIGVIDWDPSLFEVLDSSQARVKCFCFMGFPPTDKFAAILRREIPADSKSDSTILRCFDAGMVPIADSSWQLNWIQGVLGVKVGPAFGGINSRMFFPGKKGISPIRIGYSGDPRERKGTDTVEKAIELIVAKHRGQVEIDSYWNRKFSQDQIVEFYQSCHIFLDAHRRAGWCNPVLEAMACGAVPICTDIPASGEFALDDRTAFRVPVDDFEAMASKVGYLLENPEILHLVSISGVAKAREFDYSIVGARFLHQLKRDFLGND